MTPKCVSEAQTLLQAPASLYQPSILFSRAESPMLQTEFWRGPTLNHLPSQAFPSSQLASPFTPPLKAKLEWLFPCLCPNPPTTSRALQRQIASILLLCRPQILPLFSIFSSTILVQAAIISCLEESLNCALLTYVCCLTVHSPHNSNLLKHNLDHVTPLT